MYILCFVRIKEYSSRHSGIHSMNPVNGLKTQPCQHAEFNHLLILLPFTELWLSAYLVLGAGSPTQRCVVSILKSTCLTICKAMFPGGQILFLIWRYLVLRSEWSFNKCIWSLWYWIHCDKIYKIWKFWLYLHWAAF